MSQQTGKAGGQDVPFEIAIRDVGMPHQYVQYYELHKVQSENIVAIGQGLEPGRSSGDQPMCSIDVQRPTFDQSVALRIRITVDCELDVYLGVRIVNVRHYVAEN